MTNKTLFTLLFVAICCSCNNNEDLSNNNDNVENTDKETFNKEFKKALSQTSLTSPAESFLVNANKSETIVTRNGSRIHIPAQAFVDKNGNKVSGDVNFKVMEFNTIGEIIASNLPMTFTDDQGERVQFESAGMFSLEATSNNEELLLADNKKIKVEYATDVEGPFNFYKLKDDSTGWSLKDTDCLPKKNKYKEQLSENLDSLNNNVPEKMKPVVTFQEGDTLFDIKNESHLDNNILSLFTGIMWKYIGEDPSLNPNKNSNVFMNKYNFVNLQEIDTSFVAYELSFRANNDSVISFPAVPIFQGEILDKRNKKMNDRLKQIQFHMRSIEEKQKAAKREQALLRTFNVDQLGVYNYDVKYKDDKLVPFIADFKFQGEDDILSNVYLIPSSRRIVVKYTPDTFDEFSINPNDNNKIIAILPNNKVFVLNNKDLQNMNLHSLSPNTKVDFILKSTGKEIESSEELDNILADL